jgi:hypothetical protein
MSEQAFGGYRCDRCGVTFNSYQIWMSILERTIEHIQQLHNNNTRSQTTFSINNIGKHTLYTQQIKISTKI